MNLLFAVLWSVVVFLVLDNAGRRVIPVARQRTLAAAAAAVAFLLGAFLSPLHHDGPAAASAVAVSPAATPVPPPRDVSAACRAGKTNGLPSNAVGSVDSAIDSKTRSPIPNGVSLRPQQGIALLGWAGDRDHASAAAALCLDVDRNVVTGSPVIYGGDRADVADVYKRPGLRFTGFEIPVPPRLVTPGSHTVRVIVIDNDGKRSALEPERRLRVR